MNSPLEIYYDIASQSLTYIAPEGRASTITSSDVYDNINGDDDTAESATSGSAAVDTNPNTTVDANSGAGQGDPRKINLTATTGCTRGGVYLITGSNTESEWVEVTEVSSGDHVLARNPLKNAYVATNTFVTTQITQALSDTWVADKNNLSSAGLRPGPRWRWRLVYTVTTQKVIEIEFDLVRYKQRADIVPTDVERLFPGFLDRVQTYDSDTQGRATITAAQAWVDAELYHLGLRDEDLRDARSYARLVCFAANAEQHRQAFNAGGAGQAQYEVSRAELDEQFRKLITSGRTPTDDTGSGAANAGERKPLWVR